MVKWTGSIYFARKNAKEQARVTRQSEYIKIGVRMVRRDVANVAWNRHSNQWVALKQPAQGNKTWLTE